MALTTTRIARLILNQLAHSEMRLLVLTVAVPGALTAPKASRATCRKRSNPRFRKLVADKQVQDVGGVYMLSSVKL